MKDSAQIDHPASPAERPLFDTVAQAIGYLRANARRQPSLGELAGRMGFSEGYLQRVFSEWAGVSPKRFLQYLSKEYALQALRDSDDVLSATLAAGLSSPGRLHDLMVSCEAMTPGEIKSLGDGMTIGFGLTGTPFGDALVAWTTRGICHFEFCDDCMIKHNELARLWPRACLRRDDPQAREIGAAIFPKMPGRGELHLVLRGTNFQIKVWEALLRIPPGQIISYTQLAKLAGSPGARRAVGSALAANCVGYLIPCHRVIRESGDLSHYRWGIERKAMLLAWEAARVADETRSVADR